MLDDSGLYIVIHLILLALIFIVVSKISMEVTVGWIPFFSCICFFMYDSNTFTPVFATLGICLKRYHILNWDLITFIIKPRFWNVQYIKVMFKYIIFYHQGFAQV